MRKVKTFLTSLVAVLALAGSAQAQTAGVLVQPFKAKYVSQIITAADTDVAGYIKYTGNGGVATVAVEADGNLTFTVAGAAYDGFECPVSGALGGVIDVSNAACNTAGEVVDIVNSDTRGYFKMVLAAALRSDDIDASWLADAADSDVESPTGEVLFYDSSDNDDVQVGLWDLNQGIQVWLPHGQKKLTRNPFNDTESVLLYAHEQITNAGTVGNVEIHCTVENYVDGKASSEVDRIVYLEAGAATTVVGKIDEFINAGGLHCQGGKLWMRLLASGADSSATLAFLTGYHIPLRLN